MRASLWTLPNARHKVWADHILDSRAILSAGNVINGVYQFLLMYMQVTGKLCSYM